MATKSRYNEAAGSHVNYWFVNDAERQRTLQVLSGALWHGLIHAAVDANVSVAEGCDLCHNGLTPAMRNPVTIDTVCATHDGTRTSVNAYRWVNGGDTHSVGLWETDGGKQRAALWVHPSLNGSRCAVAFDLKRDALVSAFTISVLFKALWTLEMLAPPESGQVAVAKYDPDKPVVYAYDAAMDLLRLMIAATKDWVRPMD